MATITIYCECSQTPLTIDSSVDSIPCPFCGKQLNIKSPQKVREIKTGEKERVIYGHGPGGISLAEMNPLEKRHYVNEKARSKAAKQLRRAQEAALRNKGILECPACKETRVSSGFVRIYERKEHWEEFVRAELLVCGTCFRRYQNGNPPANNVELADEKKQRDKKKPDGRLVKWTLIGIPEDGICPFCQQQKSQRKQNWRRLLGKVGCTQCWYRWRKGELTQ